MDRRTAKLIAKIWNAEWAGSTMETMTEAKATSDAVEIVPTGNNDGMTFYHVEELADIARAFHANSLVSFRSGKCIAQIF